MRRSPPIGRRQVLQLALVSVLGACTASGHGRAGAGSRPTSALPPPPVVNPGAAVDVLILQTASSLEHYASGIYTEVAGLDIAGRTGLVPLLSAFAGHHADHAATFESATVDAGGRSFTQPNVLLSKDAMSRLAGLQTEADVLEFVYQVEVLSAATHRRSVGLFADPARNALVMGIGGVEARHMTVLGTQIAAVSGGQASGWAPWPASGFPDALPGLQPGVGL